MYIQKRLMKFFLQLFIDILILETQHFFISPVVTFNAERSLSKTTETLSMDSIFFIYIVLNCLTCCLRGQIASVSRNHSRLFLPLRLVSAEHISKEFYYAIERSDNSKENLQHKLQHFLENLQKNLTMSTVLSDFGNSDTSAENYIVRMHELSTFFYEASKSFGQFSNDVETFYEITKNSSHALLLKLRQVPTAQPKYVKILLTNYFAEMEFFHMLFSEIVDDALEYTIGTLSAIQKIFFLR